MKRQALYNELILGLVTPRGTSATQVLRAVEACAKKLAARCERIPFGKAGANAVLAGIHAGRSEAAPANRIVVVEGIAHTADLDLLRSAYGRAFFLLGINPSARERETAGPRQRPDSNARRVFERADFFTASTNCGKDVARFLELAFGNTQVTPTKPEFFMCLASTASAVSGNLSRQVGAVIVSPGGEVLALGYNEVPKFGGGVYATGDAFDARDAAMGFDSSERSRRELLAGVEDLAARKRIAGLIEFDRTAHAEMEAIIACARRGVPLSGATLYSTTFPCHNCAKHMVSAGIERCVYVEAYPKSLALELHRDSIRMEDEDGTRKRGARRMELTPFLGISPRRYFDLFSIAQTEGRPEPRKHADRSGSEEAPHVAWKFEAKAASPRFPLRAALALECERAAAESLGKEERRTGKKVDAIKARDGAKVEPTKRRKGR